MKNCTLVLRALLCTCLLVTAGLSPSYSQQIEKGLTTSTGEYLGFLEYKPTDYGQDASTKYPIIIFLHGIGERGNGTTELNKVACCGIPRMIKYGHKMRFTWNGKTETFLVLSPQSPRKYGMWPESFIDDLIKYAKENLRIDTNRIFLTGLSMGGGGTYKYISSSEQRPRNISAAATICAPCTFSNGANVARANLPLWSFHAIDDSITDVACTNGAINKINGQNPAVKPLKTLWPTGGHIVWDRVYTDTSYKFDGVLNIYEWFLGQNKSLAVNKLPVADAGTTIQVSAATGIASLNASASRDADGSVLRYVWRKISGPPAGVITNIRGAAATTTVTGLTVPGTYQYQLAVVDDRAGFAFDTVTVMVTASTVVPNKAPVAKAGSDVVMTLPVDSALLDGRSSTDADGRIVSYKWLQVSGPSVAVGRLDSAVMRLRGLVKGMYSFRLTVTDDKTAVASDELVVTVNAAPPPPPVIVDTPVVVPPVIVDTPVMIPPVIVDTPVVVPPVNVDTSVVQLPAVNRAPVANAGADKALDMRFRDSLWISANASQDTDGYIASFRWSKVSGPDSCIIRNPGTGKTFVQFLAGGVYVFRVTATDNKGAQSTDEVTIQVTPNIYPLASAGRDMKINLLFRDSMPLNATNSRDVDGYIKSFEWTKVSGPDSCVFRNANAGNTIVSNLKAGTYVFRVKVTDNSRGVSTDDVVLTVDAAPVNSLPLALAGTDRIIYLDQANSCRVNANASSDADGYIKSFAWTKASGPETYSIDNPRTGSTMIRGLVEGTYVFRVTVTDNRGGVSTDNMKIIVEKSAEPVDSAGMVSNAMLASDAALLSPAAGVTEKGLSAVYPNPASSSITVNYPAAASSGSAVILIYDITGTLAKTIPFPKGKGFSRQNVNVSDLKNGLYYLKVMNGSKAGLQTRFIKN